MLKKAPENDTLEEEVPWRDDYDSQSDSVIQRAITREDYIKSKLLGRFKAALVEYLPEGGSLRLRYDMDGISALHLSKLETALRMLGLHRGLFSFAAPAALDCHVFPAGPDQLAVQLTWPMPLARQQTRFRAQEAIRQLVQAHQHKYLSIQLQHNKESFAASNIIGVLMVFSEEVGARTGAETGTDA